MGVSTDTWRARAALSSTLGALLAPAPGCAAPCTDDGFIVKQEDPACTTSGAAATSATTEAAATTATTAAMTTTTTAAVTTSGGMTGSGGSVSTLGTGASETSSSSTGSSHCDNAALDGDETDIDCGGSCSACARGLTCSDDGDCESERCVDSRCVPFNCELAEVALGVGGFAISHEFSAVNLGESLAVLGDMNDDGRAEIAVASRGDSTVFVVFGRDSVDPVVLSSDLQDDAVGFRVTVPEGFAGIELAAVPDLNGDGRSELLIGAPGYAMDEGAAWVVFGKADGSPVDLDGLGAGGFGIYPQFGELGGLGAAVVVVDDMSGDGLAELVVGGPRYDPQEIVDAGVVLVVHGKADPGDVMASMLSQGMGGFILEGAVAQQNLGRSLASAGDLNGDDVPDVLIGSDNAAHVVFGTDQTDTLSIDALVDGSGGIAISVENDDDIGLGSSVGGGGDLDDDGEDDLLLGAIGADASLGRVYGLFAAGGDGDRIVGDAIDDGFIVAPSGDDLNLGSEVRLIGDLDGDGFDDVLISGTYSVSPPRAFLVYGKPDAETVSLETIDQDPEGFALIGEGDDVVSRFSLDAGDIDGDGDDDLVAGAPYYNFGDGRVYVVFTDECAAE